MPRVLVADAWTRVGLSVVRALGTAGHEVHAATHKRISPAVYSRFCATRHFLPHRSKPDHVERLRALLTSRRWDLVLPLEAETYEVIYALESEGLEIPWVAPARDSFVRANDKWEVYRLACGLGVAAPAAILVADLDQVREETRTWSYPLVVKARGGSGSRGTVVVEDPDALARAWTDIEARYGTPMVQECLPRDGPGMGVGALFDRGEPVQTYSYRRLREYPLSGGPSTLRETTDDPALIEAAVTLLQALDWHGLAMMEFKHDLRDGVAKVLEINPRMWGSVELARASGLNFPDKLLSVLRGERPAQEFYTVGLQCRWLLPGDVAHFLANPARLSLEPSFFRFRGPNLVYDQLVREDLRGSLAAVVCTALSVFDAETWKMGVFRNRA